MRCQLRAGGRNWPESELLVHHRQVQVAPHHEPERGAAHSIDLAHKRQEFVQAKVSFNSPRLQLQLSLFGPEVLRGFGHHRH